MNTLAAISMGYFISSAIKDGTTALMLSPMMAMPLMIVGGFFSNAGEMPIYIEIFSYVSPMMYTFNNLAMLEFENSDYPSAQQFLSYMDIDRTYWTGILYLGILIVSAQVIAVIMLKVLISKFQ